MPKTGKRSRGGKTASTASPASRRSARASTRAATSASSSATRQSITEPTTHGTETRDPGVPLGDLLELVQAQVRRLTELQAQQQSASAASPPPTTGAAHQGSRDATVRGKVPLQCFGCTRPAHAQNFSVFV